MRIAAALLLAASLRAAAGEICAYDGTPCFDAPETVQALPREAFGRNRGPLLFLQERGSIRDLRGGYLILAGAGPGSPREAAEAGLARFKSSATWAGSPGEAVVPRGLIGGAEAYSHGNGCAAAGRCLPATLVYFSHGGAAYQAACLKDLDGCLAVLRTVRPGAARPRGARSRPSKSRVLTGLVFVFLGLVLVIQRRHRLRQRALESGEKRSRMADALDYLVLLCGGVMVLVGFGFMKP